MHNRSYLFTTMFLTILLSTFIQQTTQTLQIDVNKTIIQNNREWSRVKLNFNSVKQPYTVEYDQYPEGWYQIMDFLYIPIHKKNDNQKYPCKVTVRDASGQEIKVTVVLYCTNEKLFVSDLVFGYDEVFSDSFFNSGVFKGKPSFVKSQTYKQNKAGKIITNQVQSQSSSVSSSSSMSKSPGAGILPFLSGMSGNNQTVSLATLQSSIKLRQSLKNAKNKQSQPGIGGGTQAKNIQQAAVNQINTSPSGGSASNTQTYATNQQSQQLSLQDVSMKNMGNDGRPNNVFGTTSQSLNTLVNNNNGPSSGGATLNQKTVQIGTFNMAASPVNVFDQGSTNTISFGLTGGSIITGNSGLTAGSSSDSLFGIINQSGTSGSSAITSSSGFSGSSGVSGSFGSTTNSGTGARIQLLPIPNTLFPGSPNILDNPNISASDKQTILLSNIKNTQIQQSTQTKPIQSFFFKLPGPQQLDSIILTSDSFAILKTIQKVIQSDLDCQQKISYLSDFFGRIQSAISLKAFSAAQLKVIVDTAQSQVARLMKLIQDNRRAFGQLGVQQIRDKLSASFVQLQDAYNLYNSVEVQLQNKKISLAVLQKQTDIVASTSQNNRQELTIQILQLNELNNKIAILQGQYAQATGKRQSILSNIDVLTQSISSSQQQITQSQTRIKTLQKYISSQSDTTQSIKGSYQALQISIQRQRSEISSRQKKSAQITLLISNLQQRLSLSKQKMTSLQISRLKSFIQNIQVMVVNIRKQTDDVNFRCYQLKQFQIQQTNNTFVYNILLRDYNTYLQNCYQVRLDNFNNLKSYSKIGINTYGILDNSWINNFGNPYSDAAYNGAQQFWFNEDFVCVNQGFLDTGFGTIRNIGKKYIQIDNGGRNTQRLNLGACSRIQSTSQIPKVGQKLYFRGQKLNNNEYNIYKGSCV